MPQLAYKADNEIFVAAIHLRTQVIVSIVHPQQTAKETQQRNTGPVNTTLD